MSFGICLRQFGIPTDIFWPKRGQMPYRFILGWIPVFVPHQFWTWCCLGRLLHQVCRLGKSFGASFMWYCVFTSLSYEFVGTWHYWFYVSFVPCDFTDTPHVVVRPCFFWRILWLPCVYGKTDSPRWYCAILSMGWLSSYVNHFRHCFNALVSFCGLLVFVVWFRCLHQCIFGRSILL